MERWCLVIVATLVAVLWLLVLVFKLASHDGAGNGSDDAMATQLVSAKVTSSTATKSTHQPSVALSLCVGVCGSVLLLLSRLTVGVLALRILVLRIGALLWELVLGLGTWILALLLSILPLLLVVWGYLLAMLESAVGWRSVLLVVVLLLAAIVALVSRLLRRVAGLLVSALIVTMLLLGVLALALGRVLLVALVVLIVRARHCARMDLI